MSEHGDRAGARPAGPGRRRPPSRRMRERADEMADLLAHAAPAVRASRTRRSAAIPAAVVALGALTVGGVGVAVGLDAKPAGATALPGGPSAPVDAGGRPIGPAETSETSTTSTRTTSAVVDVPVGSGGDRDESSSARDDRRPGLDRPPVQPPSSRTATSTSSRTSTSRPRPTSTREADDEPSGSTTRSGRSTTPEGAQRGAGGFTGRSAVPSGSPIGDQE